MIDKIKNINPFWLVILGFILSFIVPFFTIIFALDISKIWQIWDILWWIVWSLWALAWVLLFHKALITQQNELKTQQDELRHQRLEFKSTRITNIIYKQSQKLEEKIKWLSMNIKSPPLTWSHKWEALFFGMLSLIHANVWKLGSNDQSIVDYFSFYIDWGTRSVTEEIQNSLHIFYELLVDLDDVNDTKALSLLIKFNYHINSSRNFLFALRTILEKYKDFTEWDWLDSYIDQELSKIENSLKIIKFLEAIYSTWNS